MIEKPVPGNITLDAVINYEIKVSGALQGDWVDWIDGTLETDTSGETLPVSTVTAKLDQAALHGILRRLYSLGFPLISIRRLYEEQT